MILSSMVDLRVRGGIVPAHEGKLDKVASWVNRVDGFGHLDNRLSGLVPVTQQHEGDLLVRACVGVRRAGN